MESNVEFGESLPAMNLCIQHAKLQGFDISTCFTKLKHHTQMALWSWHLEVASKHPRPWHIGRKHNLLNVAIQSIAYR
jgi:hypothetical protein